MTLNGTLPQSPHQREILTPRAKAGLLIDVRGRGAVADLVLPTPPSLAASFGTWSWT
jgi:hypothetical protein